MAEMSIAEALDALRPMVAQRKALDRLEAVLGTAHAAEASLAALAGRVEAAKAEAEAVDAACRSAIAADRKRAAEAAARALAAERDAQARADAADAAEAARLAKARAATEAQMAADDAAMADAAARRTAAEAAAAEAEAALAGARVIPATDFLERFTPDEIKALNGDAVLYAACLHAIAQGAVNLDSARLAGMLQRAVALGLLGEARAFEVMA